jgi:hypothetical protein
MVVIFTVSTCHGFEQFIPEHLPSFASLPLPFVFLPVFRLSYSPFVTFLLSFPCVLPFSSFPSHNLFLTVPRDTT